MQENSSKQNNWLGSCMTAVFTLGIFLVIGAGLTYWGWNILQNAKASSSWPTAEGVVTSSEVSHSSNSEGGDSYSPEVTYRYQVGDVVYENNTIKFGENAYSSRRKAENIASTYPVARDVTVYYDPGQPDRSVLEPGVSGGSYILLGIGILFILIALVTAPIIFFFRNRE